MKITRSHADLTLEAAQLIANAALARVQTLGKKMCLAVVDTSGHPLVTLRMPGAPLASQEYARRKAYTAVSFGVTTAAWREVLDPQPTTRNGLSQHADVALFGGGEPVIIDGEVVGAIGASGGTEEEDVICARAGVEALNQA